MYTHCSSIKDFDIFIYLQCYLLICCCPSALAIENIPVHFQCEILEYFASEINITTANSLSIEISPQAINNNK